MATFCVLSTHPPHRTTPIRVLVDIMLVNYLSSALQLHHYFTILPNNKIFVRNNQNGVTDTLIAIEEIDFKGSSPDVLIHLLK
jgi:hypothetical protein